MPRMGRSKITSRSLHNYLQNNLRTKLLAREIQNLRLIFEHKRFSNLNLFNERVEDYEPRKKV